jgi:hypothetical protein
MQLDAMPLERRDGVLGYLLVDLPAYARHTGAQIGELVVELPLAVGGLAGEQDSLELAGSRSSRCAPGTGGVR